MDLKNFFDRLKMMVVTKVVLFVGIINNVWKRAVHFKFSPERFEKSSWLISSCFGEIRILSLGGFTCGLSRWYFWYCFLVTISKCFVM